MSVASFLTPKHEVTWLPADVTIRQALNLMQVRRHVAVPLLDAGGHYVGTLTDGDLLRHLIPYFGREPGELTAALETPIADVERQMQNHPVHIDAPMATLTERAVAQSFVPVVDDRGVFSGIVRRQQLFEHCAQRAGLLP